MSKKKPSKQIRVSFLIQVPADVTPEQVEDYVTALWDDRTTTFDPFKVLDSVDFNAREEA